MDIKRRILSLLPSKKWCGCSNVADDKSEYQFRVESIHGEKGATTMQIREKEVCSRCEEQDVSVEIERPCIYAPRNSGQMRAVGFVDDEMIDYGFKDRDDIAKLLVELRLSHVIVPPSE